MAWRGSESGAEERIQLVLVKLVHLQHFRHDNIPILDSHRQLTGALTSTIKV